MGIKIKALRIIGSLPNFIEIYKCFRNSQKTISVFEETYSFKENELPSDSEYEFIDSKRKLITDCVILQDEVIKRFAHRFRVTSNCIHVYDNLDLITPETTAFKKLAWDWAYYCHDDSLIEIFVNRDHDDGYSTVKSKYNWDEIEFPGSINKSGGMRLF